VRCPLSQAKADHTPPACSPTLRTLATSQPDREPARYPPKRVGLAVSIASNAESFSRPKNRTPSDSSLRGNPSKPSTSSPCRRRDQPHDVPVRYPDDPGRVREHREQTRVLHHESRLSFRVSRRRASSASTAPPMRPQRPRSLRRPSSSAPSRSIRANTPRHRSAGSAMERRAPGRRTRFGRLQAPGFRVSRKAGGRRRHVTPAPPQRPTRRLMPEARNLEVDRVPVHRHRGLADDLR
jgi:hypothetical protein